jgi:hypothetical protein
VDLIYTNAKRVEQGVLLAYALDLSFGVDENENDFEITLGKTEPLLEDDSIIYMEGTEYGGIVSGMRSNSTDETRVHLGRTWHGVLNDKVICPDPGADHLIVSGDANEILGDLIARLDLGDLFSARSAASGITIQSYKFARYVRGYDGMRALLASQSAKLKMAWAGDSLELYAEPIVDYTDQPVDGEEASLTVERYGSKVNHLICLGSGELAARDVIHLYVDQFGRVGNVQYYTGLAEVVGIYDYPNANSREELRTNGVKQLEALRNIDKISVTAYEDVGLVYDIGDIIGGTDTSTGNTAKAAVAQKVVKIKNGAVSINYKTV